MFKILCAALAVSLCLPAFASSSPFPKGQRLVTSLPRSFTSQYNFEGIVALNNCSGSLVQLEGAADSDQALVLTNGHCHNPMPSPGQVVFDRPSNRRFDVLDSGGRSVGRVNADKVLYSTMTKTDMTLYRLRETYAQIRSRYNTRPLVLSSQHPQVGSAIEIISGYWERGYTCNIEFFVHQLDEGGYSMADSMRYSRPGCEVIGGTSGSPVVAAGTRTVIGVNNTGNEDGSRCTINNPCEIDDHGGVTYTKGYSYAQQTYWVYGCLTAQRELDLSLPGCQLPH